MTILGSLVLHSDREVPKLVIPELAGLSVREGHHVSSKHNGAYTEYYGVEPVEVLVPQRYKRMTVLASDNVKHDVAHDLSTLDSEYADARQLYKLGQLMRRFPGTWVACVNIVNTGVSRDAMSGAFYLMSQGQKLWVSLMFDSVVGSVQLVWSDFDHKHAIRQQQLMNYSFYPMPTVHGQPLFIPSQSLCSKWWRLTQKFDIGRYGHIRACNALQLMLYKNPNVASL